VRALEHALGLLARVEDELGARQAGESVDDHLLVADLFSQLELAAHLWQRLDRPVVQASVLRIHDASLSSAT
jgi:hypothetical protein